MNMNTEEQIENLTDLLKRIENDYNVRMKDLEYDINDLHVLLEQQEAQIRNLRNEG